MDPGPCAGVDGDGAGSCVNPVSPGFTGGWAVRTVQQATLDAIANGDNLCPWCVLQRGVDARIPGFTRGRANRIGALMEAFHCFQIANPGSLHRHALDLDGETVSSVGGDEPLPDGW